MGLPIQKLFKPNKISKYLFNIICQNIYLILYLILYVNFLKVALLTLTRLFIKGLIT